MKHVALLRAVNLAGKNRLAMADLRALLEGLGLGEPRTLLQSGNAVFTAEGLTTGELERTLERAARERLGLRTEFFVRTAEQWRAVIEGNPFRDEARREPGRLLLLLLAQAPEPERLVALRAAIRGRERVALGGGHAYAVYPDGVGRSKLTSALLEKHLGTRCTGRNWSTVLKLQALLDA